MKVYLTYGPSDTLYSDEVVDGVFHKREDALAHAREAHFSLARLSHLKNSIGLVVTEEQIQRNLTKFIQEMEVK